MLCCCKLKLKECRTRINTELASRALTSESIINFEIDAATNQITVAMLHGIIPLKNAKRIRHMSLQQLKPSDAFLYLICFCKLCRFMQICISAAIRNETQTQCALIFIHAVPSPHFQHNFQYIII